MADEGSKSSVIDWEAALEQCEGDEEFTCELLNDLKEEATTNYSKIKDALENTPETWPDDIRRAGHAIKGAAAQLHCEELRSAAFDLEARAKPACPTGSPEDLDELTQLAVGLHTALAHYLAFLEEKGI